MENARSVSRTPFVIDGYATVDAHLGYAFPDGHSTLTAFGKNIFNKFYATNIVSENDVIARQAGLPAEWIVSYAYKF